MFDPKEIGDYGVWDYHAMVTDYESAKHLYKILSGVSNLINVNDYYFKEIINIQQKMVSIFPELENDNV